MATACPYRERNITRSRKSFSRILFVNFKQQPEKEVHAGFFVKIQTGGIVRLQFKSTDSRQDAHAADAAALRNVAAMALAAAVRPAEPAAASQPTT